MNSGVKSPAVAKLLKEYGARGGLGVDWLPPALCAPVSRAPTGGEWIHERRYEGVRVQCRLADGRARLLSRRGRDWSARFPELVEPFSTLKAYEALIDGQLIAFDAKGAVSYFALLQHLRYGAPAHLLVVVFDLLYIDGYSLLELPLLQRKKVLRTFVEQRVVSKSAIRYSEHVIGAGDVLYREACDQMWDGLVSKRFDSPYVSGAASGWLEARCPHRRPLLVLGYNDQDPRAPALLLGAYDESGALRFRGAVVSGVMPLMRAGLRARLDGLGPGNAEQITALPKLRGGERWVLPQISVLVDYRELTAEQFVRRARVHALSEARAESVAWESGMRRRAVGNGYAAARYSA